MPPGNTGSHPLVTRTPCCAGFHTDTQSSTKVPGARARPPGRPTACRTPGSPPALKGLLLTTHLRALTMTERLSLLFRPRRSTENKVRILKTFPTKKSSFLQKEHLHEMFCHLE